MDASTDDEGNRRRNLGYFFDDAVARAPDKVAIIDLWGGKERQYTYAQLDGRMNRVAAMLARIGVTAGERVAMVCGNRVEFLEIFFGAMRAGIIPVLINNKLGADALSFIVNRSFSYQRGKAIVEQLRKVVPRQQFEVTIQAALGAKIIAADVIKPSRQNVIAQSYGGDVSRKRKLLEKQKKGKKRMKNIGSIEVPQEAFLSVLKVAE